MAQLGSLFGGYDPDCLEERFPDLGGEKPAAWTGSYTAHPVVGYIRPRDVSSS
jgi:hypothetical protein